MKSISTKLMAVGTIAVIFFTGCKKQENSTIENPESINSTSSFSSSIGNIAEIDISKRDSCYYWTKTGLISSGTVSNSTSYRPQQSYALPANITPNDVVAVAIGINNNCYFWYDNGTVSKGISNNAIAYINPAPYTIPAGETTTSILAISISKTTNKVYTWYKDGMLSVGITTNLSYYMAPTAFKPESGKTINDIVGIGIKGSDDHCITWYNDGLTKTYSEGTTTHLDYYAGTKPAVF